MNMKLNFAGKISKSSMILLIVAALFAVAGAFTSVWRIDLTAPQYPEGMVLTSEEQKVSLVAMRVMTFIKSMS